MNLKELSYIFLHLVKAETYQKKWKKQVLQAGESSDFPIGKANKKC